MAWISEEAAATALGISFKTLRRRVGNGSIRAMRQDQQIYVDLDIPQLTHLPKPSAETVREAPIHLSRKSPGDTASETIVEADTSNKVRSGWWMGLTIWVLLTLLLTAGGVAVWKYREFQSQLVEAETRHQQALREAERSQDEHARSMQAQSAAARGRENRLNEDLSTAHSRLNALSRSLEMQKDANVRLTSELNEAAARLATAQARNTDLAGKLAAAQISVQLKHWQSSWADAVQQMANHIPWPNPRGRRRNDYPAGSHGPPAEMASTAALEAFAASVAGFRVHGDDIEDGRQSKHRPIPHQPSSLGVEDARAALRSIVTHDAP